MPEHLSASKIVHDFLRGKSLLLRRPAARRDLIRENLHPIHSIFHTVFPCKRNMFLRTAINTKAGHKKSGQFYRPLSGGLFFLELLGALYRRAY